MNANINDGGPVFPYKRPALAVDGSPHFGGALEHVPGMSLRDYFAAQAMTGLIGLLVESSEAVNIPRAAYAIADAMLKAKEA